MAGATHLKNAMLKSLLLGSIFTKRPVEFYDRVLTLLEVKFERLFVRPMAYEVGMWQELLSGVERATGKNIGAFLDEPSLVEIAEEVCQRVHQIRSRAPFLFAHNADFALARLCYLVCRALKPEIVLETGVAYGVTSAFILQALEMNGKGILHSVDLPPLGRDADRFVGILVPQDLKAPWCLHRGVSKRVLPRLLSSLDHVDVFVHDSLHTYRNMQREFRMVTPYLTHEAVLIVDDVDGNSAFKEWMGDLRAAFWGVAKEEEKRSLFGIGVKADAHPSSA